MKRSDTFHLGQTTLKLLGVPCTNCGQQWLYQTDSTETKTIEYKCQNCGVLFNLVPVVPPAPAPYDKLIIQWREDANQAQRDYEQGIIKVHQRKAHQVLRTCARELEKAVKEKR